ncbi:heat shock protein 30 [Thozetella sp. PMI_491]|nr:heat shock protein 30 [Thozetella sp. PMI_491]
MGLIKRANDALTVNPPAGDEFLTTNGSDWLYTVAAIHAFTFLAVFGLSHVARAGEKIFHYIFLIANLVGAIVYYAEGSDLGFSVIQQANSLDTHGATRQIFFAKYILWVVSFPTASLALGLLSGVSWATIFYNIFLSWVWVIGYLVSAYTATNYKWGFYAFATVAYFFLAASTLAEGTSHAKRVGVSGNHNLLAFCVNFLWLQYPIVFGLTDGGNRIGVVGGFIWFGILDTLLIPVLTVAFLVLARKWDYSKLNLTFTQYGRVNAAPGTFPEKEAAPATGGVTGPAAV